MTVVGRKSPLGDHGWISTPERRETAISGHSPIVGERLLHTKSGRPEANSLHSSSSITPLTQQFRLQDVLLEGPHACLFDACKKRRPPCSGSSECLVHSGNLLRVVLDVELQDLQCFPFWLSEILYCEHGDVVGLLSIALEIPDVTHSYVDNLFR